MREVVSWEGRIAWRRSIMAAVLVTVRVRLLVRERVGIVIDWIGCVPSPKSCVGYKGVEEGIG